MKVGGPGEGGKRVLDRCCVQEADSEERERAGGG